uniref:Uncharacterized protein n=1 Tax=viral metagenome TaxID=1070528 RepID=A0A6M3XS18_9ZZZZ
MGIERDDRWEQERAPELEVLNNLKALSLKTKHKIARIRKKRASKRPSRTHSPIIAQLLQDRKAGLSIESELYRVKQLLDSGDLTHNERSVLLHRKKILQKRMSES